MKALTPRRRKTKAINAQDAGKLMAFLERGELGPIKPGMTRDTVIRILGQPTNTSNPQAILPPLEILWYGLWLELTFNDGILEYTSLRYKWQRWRHRRLRLAGIFDAQWSRKISIWNYLRFQTFLHSRRIGYNLTRYEDGSLAIYFPAGAIVFDTSRRLGLHSINHNVFQITPLKEYTTRQIPPHPILWSRKKRLSDSEVKDI